MLTLFTCPKPFQGKIAVLQRNAIRSWTALGAEVQVLMIGDEPGTAEAARELGIEHVGRVERNASGTPLINSIFDLARRHARHPVLGYVNADILFLDDLLPSIRRVVDRFPRYLIVGRRWDLDVDAELDVGPGWQPALRRRLADEGVLHPPAGSDYFIFPRTEYADIPPFALGRAGWDNWMIYIGRKRRLPVIDATESITVVHQAHDYAHLPGGQPHYRLPESAENLRMGGGREMVFRLPDADWGLSPSGLRYSPLGRAPLGRRIESAVYLLLGPGRPARVARMLMHPVETARYFLRRGTPAGHG
jgi:hypothetical protein